MNGENIGMKELNLFDLCIEILLQWRIIVLGMILGACVFAGLGYARSYNQYKQEQIKVAEAEEELSAMQLQDANLTLKEQIQDKLTDVQIHNVNDVLSYEKIYEDKVAYTEESIVMQLDPNDVKIVEMTFHISAESLEKAYNIEKVYEDIVCSGVLDESISKVLNISVAQANELICLERSTYNTIEGADTLRLFVRHYDEKVCEEVAQLVLTYVNVKQKELVDILGEHTIVLIDYSPSAISDTSVFSQQQTYTNEIISLKNTIVNLKSKFGKLEWQYYDILLNGEITELSTEKIRSLEDQGTTEEDIHIIELQKIVEKGVTIQPRISVKYVILGMVLGAFIIVFVVFLKYVFNNKVRVTDNLTDLYGINQLGVVYKEQKKNSFMGFIDKWLLSLRYYDRRIFAEAETLELLSTAIKVESGKHLLNTVYLVGCDIKDASLDVCEKIEQSVNCENLQTEIMSNILYDARAMESVVQAKGVVLVERANSTLYTEITRELEFLKNHDIAILGGVVVE